jgi:pyridoxine/pyridoxamine 5'-phosphate oxidase
MHDQYRKMVKKPKLVNRIEHEQREVEANEKDIYYYMRPENSQLQRHETAASSQGDKT